MTLFTKLAIVTNACLILLTIGALLSPFLPPMSSRLISLLGLLFPYLVISYFLFICFWLTIGKPKIALASTIILLIGFNSVLNIFGSNISISENEDSSLLTVASHNIQYHARASFNKSSTTPYELFLKRQKEVEIFCIQEVDSLANARLLGSLNYPHYFFLPNEYMGIYSRYPIIDQGILPLKFKPSGSCLWVDILYNKQKIRIYNFHLSSNRPWEINNTLEETVKKYTEDKAEYLKILKYYPINSNKRLVQAKQIRQHQRKTPHPTILCGDLNDTPNSRVFSVMREGFTDSFRKKGVGNGKTYNSWNKLLRLDYILVDQDFPIKQHQIIKEDFSDHFMIKSKIELEESSSISK